MALRKIRLQGDEVLAKVSRPVEKMTPRIHDLIGDILKPCMCNGSWPRCTTGRYAEAYCCDRYRRGAYRADQS